MGMAHFKELATIISAVDLDDAGHIRVKELFESIEAFKFIANFIISAQRTRKLLSQPPLESVFEIACGHGLVGLLLAYRFPNLQIYMYDLLRRPSFTVYLRAWEKHGVYNIVVC